MNKETKIIRKKEKGLNRHWKNYVDKFYLGSHNLESGEEMLLTIAKFEGEEMVTGQDGSKSAKMVLYFKEDKPKMILNQTNATTIASLYGSKPESWIEKQILLYAASVKAFGKTQDALRVRDLVPKIQVDTKNYAEQMKGAKTLEELQTIWKSFPVSARNDKELIELKDFLKSQLS